MQIVPITIFFKIFRPLMKILLIVKVKILFLVDDQISSPLPITLIIEPKND